SALTVAVRRLLQRKDVDPCAAASLLHGAAFGLRASLARNQSEGAIAEGHILWIADGLRVFFIVTDA
ncbi:hypothetical protein, partial [Pseudomonas sp. MF6776]|uniref:hypothetical protein n=1 Tax=Pseudomonas sp. MF6776 TaxID=2797534 RepID=UPI001F35E648